MKKLTNAIFALLFLFATFSQLDPALGNKKQNDFKSPKICDDLFRGYSVSQFVKNPRPVSVMIIDGGHPDSEHPDFANSKGESVVVNVPRLLIEGELQRPFGHDLNTELNELKNASKPDLNSWRARFVSWWSHYTKTSKVQAKSSKIPLAATL